MTTIQNTTLLELRTGEAFTGVMVPDNDQDDSFDIVQGDRRVAVWLPKTTTLLVTDVLAPESDQPQPGSRMIITNVGYTDDPTPGVPIEQQGIGTIFHLKNAST